jgi:hypothetical protein
MPTRWLSVDPLPLGFDADVVGIDTMAENSPQHCIQARPTPPFCAGHGASG